MSVDSPDRPAWTPTGGPDRSCENCDEHHTKRYIRHFGKSGTLFHCHRCLTHRDMQAGAGRMEEYDPVEHRRRHSVSDKNPIFLGETDE